MLVIGLTGGIAAGKSTVAKMLKEKGAHLLDADELAKGAMETGQPAWQAIVDWLGPSILLPDQSLERLKLANLVFSDKAKLDHLNKLVHPYVGARFLELSRDLKSNDPDGILVYDVPLLVETGIHKMVDMVLLVEVPREMQIKRLIARNGLSYADAEKRLQAQLPLAEKKQHAHAVIDNSGSIEETEKQVDCFWQGLKSR